MHTSPPSSSSLRRPAVPAPATAPEPWWKVKTIADWLNVSVYTVYRRLKAHDYAHVPPPTDTNPLRWEPARARRWADDRAHATLHDRPRPPRRLTRLDASPPALKSRRRPKGHA